MGCRIQELVDDGCRPPRVVLDQEGEQAVQRPGPSRPVGRGPGIHPGSGLVGPPVPQRPRQLVGRGGQAIVADHGGQLTGVEGHQGVEPDRGHRKGGILDGRTVGSGLDGRHQPVLGHPPPVPVEAVGAAVVPPWRVVDSSLPRVAHQEQARPVAGPLVNQEADAGDRRVHHLVRRWRPGTYQLGDSVPVHGRLGDRRTVPTAPEVLMGAGRLHVVHVGDEPGRGLWTEHLGQLSLGAPALAQCLPDEHVEAGVPQPLPRVDPRVGGCVPFRHPVVLQQPSHGGPEVNERWVRETIATHQEASLHDRLLPARAHRRCLGSSTELVRCAHPDGFRPDLGGR